MTSFRCDLAAMVSVLMLCAPPSSASQSDVLFQVDARAVQAYSHFGTLVLDQSWVTLPTTAGNWQQYAALVPTPTAPNLSGSVSVQSVHLGGEFNSIQSYSLSCPTTAWGDVCANSMNVYFHLPTHSEWYVVELEWSGTAAHAIESDDTFGIGLQGWPNVLVPWAQSAIPSGQTSWSDTCVFAVFGHPGHPVAINGHTYYKSEQFVVAGGNIGTFWSANSQAIEGQLELRVRPFLDIIRVDDSVPDSPVLQYETAVDFNWVELGVLGQWIPLGPKAAGSHSVHLPSPSTFPHAVNGISIRGGYAPAGWLAMDSTFVDTSDLPSQQWTNSTVFLLGLNLLSITGNTAIDVSKCDWGVPGATSNRIIRSALVSLTGSAFSFVTPPSTILSGATLQIDGYRHSLGRQPVVGTGVDFGAAVQRFGTSASTRVLARSLTRIWDPTAPGGTIRFLDMGGVLQ